MERTVHRAVGIDLGTTLCAVAYVSDSGQSTMVRNSEGDILTPSVIRFDNDQIVVGKKAREAIGQSPDTIVQYVKREMGNKTFSQPIVGRQLPPEVLQAYILKKLKCDVDMLFGGEYSVVITVPAYFDEPRRQATADAGQMAGFDVADIVNEPTAAALAFGEHLGYLESTARSKQEINVVVYDLGGGTFDVTLINLKAGVVESLATDGDVRLGGRDWDSRIANWLADQFAGEHGIDLRKNPKSNVELYRLAEATKLALSTRPRSAIQLAFAGFEASMELSREMFEELTADLLERTAFTTRRVVAAAGLSWDRIDRILLVGGSTRMPMVAAMLERESGITPDRSVNPDEAVARGAALYANALLEERCGRGHLKISSVNSHSLGVEGTNVDTNRREHAVLIPKNTLLPAQCSRRCVTSKANQKNVIITVLEGDSSDPANCITVGRAILMDLPNHLPKGHPIDVTYDYSRSGRLHVQARVIGTDRRVNVEFQRERNYSAEMILSWQEIVQSTTDSVGFEKLLDEMIVSGMI